MRRARAARCAPFAITKLVHVKRTGNLGIRLGVSLAAVASLFAALPASAATTMLFTFPPSPTPAPTASPTLQEIGRVRVTLCSSEKRAAELALAETARADGVIVGVMHKLGQTKFSLDDLPLPGSTKPPNSVDGPPQFAPVPGSTPIPILSLAKDASMPYWTGTRRIMDASGDLERSVRAAAEHVDRLETLAKTDPDPERRAAIESEIRALTDAVVRQAPLVKAMMEFSIRADTALSLSEAQNSASMSGANGTPQGSLVTSSWNTENLKIYLTRDSSTAHEATIKAVKSAEQVKRAAFSACP